MSSHKERRPRLAQRVSPRPAIAARESRSEIFRPITVPPVYALHHEDEPTNTPSGWVGGGSRPGPDWLRLATPPTSPLRGPARYRPPTAPRTGFAPVPVPALRHRHAAADRPHRGGDAREPLLRQHPGFHGQPGRRIHVRTRWAADGQQPRAGR